MRPIFKNFNVYSLLSVLVLLMTVACSQKDPINEPKLSDLNWMLGEWESSMEHEVWSEVWENQGDSLFLGKGFITKEGEVYPTEALSLVQREDGVYYMADPVGQSHTEFKLSAIEKGKVTFENPTHDFPQKLEYAMVGKDSLYAKVSGKDGETERAFELFWARKK